MRKSLIILAIILTVCLCGCINEGKMHYPPPTIDNVKVNLLNSNASSVKLQFKVYVRGFSKSRESCNLSCSIQLTGSRITLKEKSIKINVTHGVQVYTFNFPFNRDKNYVVTFSIIKNNTIYDTYPIEITNLQSVPNLEFGVKLRSADFQLVNITGNRAKLTAKMYFISSKEEGNLKLHLKVKPVGTSLIAAEKWINVNFTKGLKVVKTNLTVPKDYNYLFVIEAWRGNRIECTWTKPLILNPEKSKPKNETNFSLQNFVVKPMPRTMPSYTPTTKKSPSFIAVIAIICLAVVAARRFR